ncbi:MAG: hypothetical protein AAB393_09395 [Bacteroidota bacterium]
MSRPVQHPPVQTSFDVRVEERTASGLRLRCTLVYPPRESTADIWSKDTLEIRDGNNALPYDFDSTVQDMLISRQTVDTSQLALSPVTIREERGRASEMSQAVVTVPLSPGKHHLKVLYHGTTTIGPNTELVKELESK